MNENENDKRRDKRLPLPTKPVAKHRLPTIALSPGKRVDRVQTKSKAQCKYKRSAKHRLPTNTIRSASKKEEIKNNNKVNDKEQNEDEQIHREKIVNDHPKQKPNELEGVTIFQPELNELEGVSILQPEPNELEGLTCQRAISAVYSWYDRLNDFTRFKKINHHGKLLYTFTRFVFSYN